MSDIDIAKKDQGRTLSENNRHMIEIERHDQQMDRMHE
jgi:hypothetical protein